MQEILKVFEIFTSKEKRYCVFLVICMVIGATLEAVGISAILPLISILSNEQFLDKYPIIKNHLEKIGILGHINFIIFAAGLLIAWYVLKNIYMIWLTKLQVTFSLNHQITFAKKLMALYLGQPYLYHLERNTATLIRNIQSSLMIIFMNMLVSIFSLFTEIITAIVIWMMLLLVDPFTATIIAGIMACMIYSIMMSVRKKLGEQGAIQNKYGEEMVKWLNQGLGAIKETKVLRKEQYFLEQFAGAYQKYGEAQTYFSITSQLPRFFVEAMVTIGLLSLIITKLYLGIAPRDIVPLLGVLALASFRLMPCANRTISLSSAIKYYLAFFDSVREDLMAVKQRGKKAYDFDSDDQKERIAYQEVITVEKLSFQYPKGSDAVLNQISFQIPKGSFCGIIGQSGAGKTTFVDILLGLLTPTSGTILVDGQNIFQNIRSWQENLSYVPQSIYLIDGTIKENIAMGIAEDKIDDVKIKRVLEMAELYDFVDRLPEKLATPVGERGVKLSGGQRQRIGIARALYHDPEVLILDEATSALDNETEKNITDTILKLKGRITIIAVAHRVSTLKNCDFKIKFDKGKIELI